MDAVLIALSLVCSQCAAYYFNTLTSDADVQRRRLWRAGVWASAAWVLAFAAWAVAVAR